MKHKTLKLSISDGLIQGILIIILNDFITSVFAQKLSLSFQLFSSVICAVLSATFYFVILMKEYSNKRIIVNSLWGFVVFVAIRIVYFTLTMLLPIRIFPLAELNEANGLIILFVEFIYFIFSVGLRLIIFLVFVIKNNIRTKCSKEKA